MVVRTVGELARIGDADLGLRGELQIAARLDQRGVTRERHTSNAERSARAHKLQRCCRVHDPKACCQATDARGMNAMPFCSR